MIQDDEIRKARKVRDIFRGRAGREALSVIGEMCGEGRDLYAEAPTDRDLSYLAGRLSAYIGIKRMMEVADDADKEEDRAMS